MSSDHEPRSSKGILTSSEFFVSSDPDNDLSASLSSLDVSDNIDEVFQSISKHSHSLFEHVHNVNGCNNEITVTDKIPYNPPNKKGTYLAVVSSHSLKYISEAYTVCRLAPWSKADKKPHYEKICLVKQSNGKYKAVQQHKPNGVYFGSIFYATHPKFSKVKKWIYSANLSKEEQIPNGTFVVIVYDIKEDYELPPYPDHVRLQPNVAKQIRSSIMHQSAKDAAVQYNSKGHLMGNNLSNQVTDKQIQGVANRTSGRKTPHNQGRPKAENFTEFEKQIQEGTFIRAVAKGELGGKKFERYFMGTQAAFDLLEHELPTKAELKQLERQLDDIDAQDMATRFNSYEKLKK
uniref:Uncharacterized protein n=1 Tax=Panagrolaimus sp. ES5 TaxID=591445 RepID=A0AC34G8T3_9BILA